MKKKKRLKADSSVTQEKFSFAWLAIGLFVWHDTDIAFWTEISHAINVNMYVPLEIQSVFGFTEHAELLGKMNLSELHSLLCYWILC